MSDVVGLKELGEIQSHLIGGIPESPHETVVDGTPIVCLPPNWTLHEQTHLLDQPRDIVAVEQFKDLTSWIEYVKRFRLAGSAVFVTMTPSELRATAKIDYHEPSEAHWCKHQAVFTTSPTPAWLAWSSNNEKLMKQSEFADFLYRVEKPLNVPNQFQLLVTAFYGCPTMTLQADLRVRVPEKDGDPLLMGYRFYRAADKLEDLSNQILEVIRNGTELPVWR